MDFFIQQLVNGVTLGSLYALLAIGYSIVYGVLGLLNFAQGEVYMVGAFIGFGVLAALGGPAALRRTPLQAVAGAAIRLVNVPVTWSAWQSRHSPRPPSRSWRYEEAHENRQGIVSAAQARIAAIAQEVVGVG